MVVVVVEFLAFGSVELLMFRWSSERLPAQRLGNTGDETLELHFQTQECHWVCGGLASLFGEKAWLLYSSPGVRWLQPVYGAAPSAPAESRGFYVEQTNCSGSTNENPVYEVTTPSRGPHPDRPAPELCLS
jgi:hypothetical protein